MKRLEFIILAVTTVSQVIGQIFLKYGCRGFKMDLSQPFAAILTAATNIWIYGWICCAGISVLTWIALVMRFPISWAYPVTMTASYILLIIFSSIFLGERISIYLAVGILLMISGIIVASMGIA